MHHAAESEAGSTQYALRLSLEEHFRLGITTVWATRVKCPRTHRNAQCLIVDPPIKRPQNSPAWKESEVQNCEANEDGQEADTRGMNANEQRG